MATNIARGEALHTLLINELNHRVKNTLATVQSLSAQTFRSSADAEARSKFDARLGSLGRTHDILSAQKWDGADIRDVVQATLAPFEGNNPDRIQVAGPELRLSSRCVVMLSMVLHELATNAAKYGALSSPRGQVTVDWRTLTGSHDKRAELNWRERGGPDVAKPERNGFGSTLIEQGFPAQLRGSAQLCFEPDGVVCTLEFLPA
jgi:two-component sensor histidine kinase